MTQEWHRGGYYISTDKNRLDEERWWLESSPANSERIPLPHIKQIEMHKTL
jgi:hypothetical protein